ncbi:MAG: RNA methyltransferase [Muribaculaceae bacterium]|nr:RNA methyltransferase [Muribaculaceae bacterium]
METKFQMVAKTFQGLEDVLRDELIELGAENVEMGLRMVTFEGDNEVMYRANLCCRTALRILKPIVKFTADSTDELYDYVRDLDWEQFMNVDSTFSIDSTVNSAEFNHSKFVTYRVKDGIADHFNDKYGRRPSIRLNGADIQLNVHISDNRVTISLDSSGEPLSKRGYRVEQTEAPINEALAAGIIMKTGWRGDCDFVDPMCGSGTFLIEAALIAANINPGIYRESFAFEKWPDFDEELFEDIYNDDSAEREFAYKIYGGDISPEAVMIARKNIKSARVEDMIDIQCKPLVDWTDNAPEGVMVTNPPYGERLKPENINLLYKSIGSTLKTYFKGWHAWIIGFRDEQFAEIGLKPSVKIPLHNGSLECSLREYVLFDGKYSDFRADGGSVSNPDAKKDAGPKKVRHISDDDWERQAKKFNSGKGFADDRKKKKTFSRDDHKRSFDSAPRGGYRNDDDDDFDFRPVKDNRANRGNDRNKAQGRPFSRDNRNDRGERKSFDRNGGREDYRRSDGRNDRGGFRNDRDRDNRGGFRNDRDRDNRGGFRNDRDRDNRGGFRNDRDRDNRGGFRNERPTRESSYNPANSKGPRLPESSETVINTVHMRSRKGWKKQEGED